MKWLRKNKISRKSGRPSEIAVLYKTAELEQELNVGNWQDTLEQMHEALSRLSSQAGRQVSDIDLVRRQLDKLRAVLYRRDQEIDRYEDLISAYQDRLRAMGCTDFPTFNAR